MSERRTALVTGGTGFVGSHVVDALLEAGYQVRSTVRASSDRRWLEGKPVELLEADITAETPDEALAEADAVFHFAGLTRGDGNELYAVNVEGTRALVGAYAAARPGGRFIYCSSQAAAGPSVPGRARVEEDPPEPTNDYGRSKLEGERIVREHEGRLDTVILRPAGVYGPRDEDTLPFFQMASRGLIVVPGLRERRIQMVHVNDVAAAAVLAAETERGVGGTYFIAHPEVLRWRELARAIAQAVGRRHVLPLRLPSVALRGAGAIASAIGAGGSPGRLDARRAADLTERAWTCRVDRAEHVLRWSPEFDAVRGLADTADWYRREGWL